MVESRNNSRDNVAKVCLVGNHEVGKSSLIRRLAPDRFGEELPTIWRPPYIEYCYNLNGSKIMLHVWDFYHGEKNGPIPPLYYRDAKGVLVVYDISDKKSFSSIDQWIEKLERCPRCPYLVLVGNKADLESARQVSYEDGAKKAQKYGIKFIETSAKDDTNVKSVFELLASDLLSMEESKNGENSKLTLRKKPEVVKSATCF